jgi:signal transduction histidine kinase
MAGMVRLTIADTGVGIVPERLEMLAEQLDFETGTKAKSARSDILEMRHVVEKGTDIGQSNGGPSPEKTVGVGLYIAKEIISGHGGSIWVKSEGAEKGTTVVIELPVAESQSQ